MVKKWPAAVVLASMLLAFGFRVIPARRLVFTPQGVNFQEPDAWFHMRGVHNLLAHFPRHSEYDPYAIYPGGENIITGPLWDYMVGSVAWVAGAGAPSDNLVDEVGAWLPAILGALLPLPVFFLARRLFGSTVGLWSAFLVAVMPGDFLWVGHLGLADHHAAEVFASLLVLVALVNAAEAHGQWRWLAAATSGVLLAGYLNIQVTGIYVPAIPALAAILSPALAEPSSIALVMACLLLLPAGGVSPWWEYRWLALGGSLAVTAPIAVLYAIGEKRRWPNRVRYSAVAVVAVAAIGCVAISEPAMIQDLIKAIRSFAPEAPGPGATFNVNELKPLLSTGSGGFGSLFNEFGVAWIFALPALFSLPVIARRRPSILLFAVWSLAMIFAAFLHLRMAAYAGISVAILAGQTTAWIVRRIPPRTVWLRPLSSSAFVLLALSVSLPRGWAQTRSGAGPDRDWWDALTWMRWKTPEPMGDPQAWYRWWPRMEPGAGLIYPGSAYGVIALWDKGWWISGIARRIPAANGGENGAIATARFLTETHAENAMRESRSMGGRYALIGPGSVTFDFPGMVVMAGRRFAGYSRVFYVPRPGQPSLPIRVYLPDFYRSMAARLYLFEGHRFDTAAQGVEVFRTSLTRGQSGAYEETVQSVERFPSEKDAERWQAQHPLESATLASDDPLQSCVDLEELPWLRRVFVSRNEPIVAGTQPSAVKIFQLQQ